jgi:hypothetical protein
MRSSNESSTIPGGGAGNVAADLIQLSGEHGMHGVVVVDGDRRSIESFNLEHRDRLIRRPVVVGTLPPPACLGIDDLAIDVDERDAGAIPDTSRRSASASRAEPTSTIF